jgi:predicted dehydrogenase
MITRRTFLAATGGSSLLALSGLPSCAAGPAPRRFSPNDTIRLGFIGLRGRGNDLLGSFRNVPGVRVEALCDVDSEVLGKRMAEAKQRGENPTAYGDPRRLYENDAIDAVVIATPNHLHAILGIWAMQAGKHVYLEKPVSHNVYEGRQLVAAAERYGAIVQAGTQNRSDRALVPAYADLHRGDLGTIRSLHGICYRDRQGIGKRTTPLPTPTTVDYDAWLGPALDLPIYRNQFHYDWHWMWNTGNGDVGNQGPHELDMICWALRDPGLPRRAIAIGGRFGYGDAGETPNVLACYFDFGAIPVCFEVRNLVPKQRTDYHGLDATGVVITTDQGELRAQRGGAVFVDFQGKTLKSYRGDSGASHQANFIAALREGSGASLRAPLQASHHSAALAHFANASVRIGRLGTLAEAQQEATKLPGLAEHVERIGENLAGHGIDLSKPTIGVGACLQIDPATQLVVGAEAKQAEPLLTRNYRPGYVVPKLA